MKVLIDTSVWVPLLVVEHRHHEKAEAYFAMLRRSDAELLVSAHTLAELYATLTVTPFKTPLNPGGLRQLLAEEVEQAAQVIPLDAGEYARLLDDVARRDLRSGAIYDAIHVAAALKAKADRIATFNRHHFDRLVDDPAMIVTP